MYRITLQIPGETYSFLGGGTLSICLREDVNYTRVDTFPRRDAIKYKHINKPYEQNKTNNIYTKLSHTILGSNLRKREFTSKLYAWWDFLPTGNTCNILFTFFRF
jgi:hypothetical protein